jgi:hypothetical protein
VVAYAETITFSNVAYLIVKEIDEDFANDLVDLLGSFGEFGVTNATLSLYVDSYPTIVLSASGSPRLEPLRAGATVIETFFYDLFTGLTFIFTGTVQSLELARIRLEAFMDVPDISPTLKVEDSDGLGPSIYYQYDSLKETQITTFGMTLPLTICVAQCDTGDEDDKEEIQLKGDVNAELIVGAVPATTVGGVLSLIGEWKEPLGIPILTIYNIIAGLSLDLTKPFPACIAKVLLGARICLGSAQACEDQVVANRDFIEAAAYINIDVYVPKQNFFFVMISSLTIEHALRIAENLSSGLKDLDLPNVLPTAVLESGITPFDGDLEKCKTSNDTEAQVLGQQALDLDCYAYFILSPFFKNEIEEIGLEIPRGISFGGTLSLFGIFEARVKATVRKRFESNRYTLAQT